MTTPPTGPLAGLIVADLSRALAGPHAAMMLADMGARVIKVEAPTGDDSRGWGPPFLHAGDETESTYFMACNRGKESIALNLHDNPDRDTLTRLVRHTDVLVENFRPGVLDRLGLSHSTLQRINPRLIILSITGFGHDGPESGRPGYDQIAQGEAGLMSLTGPDPGHPTKVGVPIGDLLAGIYGAYGVLAAVHERATTGRGRVVHTSLLAALVGVHAFQGTRTTIAGQAPHGIGNQHPSIAPYGLFATGDGSIQIAVGSPTLWERFAPLVGLSPQDPRFATNALRVTHRGELTETIETAWASTTSTLLLDQLEAAGIPAGKVRTLKEVYAWEQTRSQGLLTTVHHPTFGTLVIPGCPLRLDENPYGGGQPDTLPPPRLDQHHDDILAWLDAAEQATPAAAARS